AQHPAATNVPNWRRRHMARGSGGEPAWKSGLKMAAVGVAAAIAISLAITYLLLFSETLGALGRGVTLSVLLPVLIGGPAFFEIGRPRSHARELRRRARKSAGQGKKEQLA